MCGLAFDMQVQCWTLQTHAQLACQCHHIPLVRRMPICTQPIRYSGKHVASMRWKKSKKGRPLLLNIHRIQWGCDRAAVMITPYQCVLVWFQLGTADRNGLRTHTWSRQLPQTRSCCGDSLPPNAPAVCSGNTPGQEKETREPPHWAFRERNSMSGYVFLMPI